MCIHLQFPSAAHTLQTYREVFRYTMFQSYQLSWWFSYCHHFLWCHHPKSYSRPWPVHIGKYDKKHLPKLFYIIIHTIQSCIDSCYQNQYCGYKYCTNQTGIHDFLGFTIWLLPIRNTVNTRLFGAYKPEKIIFDLSHYAKSRPAWKTGGFLRG